MMATTLTPSETSALRAVTVDDSAAWLQKAMDDIRRRPGVSLTYGTMVVVVSWALVAAVMIMDLGSVVPPLLSGFMLIAALIAVPLHVISRAEEDGETLGLLQAIARSRTSLPGLSVIGVVLMLVMVVWMLLSLLLFAGFYGGAPPVLTHFLVTLLSSPQAPVFLVIGTVVGAVMASVAFAVAFLSIPMLVDDPTTPAFDAMVLSAQAVMRQPGVLGGWGATLAFITVSGMIPAFLALIVVLPMASYASWHAYRAVLPEGRPS